MSNKSNSASVLGGTMIIAATIVGAGMFSLPIISSGMWVSWSLAVVFLSWFFMYHSGLMILETNLHFPVGSSFDTFIRGTLGASWNLLNNFAISFVLYLLVYAYISGGGSVLSHSLQNSNLIEFSPRLASLLFVLGLSISITVSVNFTSRIVTILIGGMAVSFVMLVGDLSQSIQLSSLSQQSSESSPYVIYAFAALPFYLTSFGFHGNVPSLLKYFGKQPQKITKCIRNGSLIALFIYLVWLICAFGNLQRSEFLPIISQGGNIADLVNALERASNKQSVSLLLNTFANIAIVSSFLGVSLGLFDFIADKFRLTDNPEGRIKTALITFAPPTLAAMIFPNGFIFAIGFAAIAAAVWGAIIPALAVKASRQKFERHLYQVWGGNKLILCVITYGVITALLHILAMLGLLPQFSL